MNPPYGREIRHWMRKAFESARAGATVVCLIPARTDTDWWHRYAIRGEIRFLKGRLKFGDAPQAAPFPSAVVVFRPEALRHGPAPACGAALDGEPAPLPAVVPKTPSAAPPSPALRAPANPGPLVPAPRWQRPGADRRSPLSTMTSPLFGEDGEIVNNGEGDMGAPGKIRPQFVHPLRPGHPVLSPGLGISGHRSRVGSHD
jgi:hypothetical protein